MRYVEAPEDWRQAPHEVSVFLGGGITGCPDWQHDAATALDKLDDVLVVNPRRATWPMGDDAAGEAQVRWEFLSLERVNVHSFWFPEETLCPITLYELGAWTRRARWLVVGVHKNYERAFDVRLQTRLARLGVPVATGFDEYTGALYNLTDALRGPEMALFR